MLLNRTRAQEILERERLDGLRCDYRPDLFNEIRLVKSDAEIEIMRRAAEISEAALLTAADGCERLSSADFSIRVAP